MDGFVLGTPSEMDASSSSLSPSNLQLGLVIPAIETRSSSPVRSLENCGSRIWKSKGEAQEAVKKESIDCFLKLLERELEDKPFYGGKSLGYMDVVLVPFACWFYTYETDGNFSIKNEYPKLIAWVKRCMEKKRVSKVLPDPHKVYDFVGVLKKYGVEF
ncbi:glutathione S-transferase 3-like protein [Cinnamomum micranthum f. kanehirae]|uniref:Glutathione S-transferase 3-like protein n=1 Tax=Cinnamomum micranthum f. kanehirae TaxID=337451 RepID=A0A3S3NYM4_9MAGN|nr:glutathione S-transferase 3-like protein [Cinnamomum micranthum f. kanehirae]